MEFPWNSHGNGSKKHISKRMITGMEMISIGVEISKKYGPKRFLLLLSAMIEENGDKFPGIIRE